VISRFGVPTIVVASVPVPNEEFPRVIRSQVRRGPAHSSCLSYLEGGEFRSWSPPFASSSLNTMSRLFSCRLCLLTLAPLDTNDQESSAYVPSILLRPVVPLLTQSPFFSPRFLPSPRSGRFCSRAPDVSSEVRPQCFRAVFEVLAPALHPLRRAHEALHSRLRGASLFDCLPTH